MTAVLTRDQADVLATYGWQTVDMLLNPTEGISYARGSMACRYGGVTGWGWETTSAGIAAWRCPGPKPAEVWVTWPVMRAAAKALPDAERTALHRARRRAQLERQRATPPYDFITGRHLPFVAPDPHRLRVAQLDQDAALLAALEVLCADPDGVAGQLDLFAVPA